jgi:hypothetical protein
MALLRHGNKAGNGGNAEGARERREQLKVRYALAFAAITEFPALSFVPFALQGFSGGVSITAQVTHAIF